MDNPIGRDVREVILRLCEDAATPRALTVAILLRHQEYDQLVSLKVDPKLYNSADDYRRDAVVTSLLKKCIDLPTSFDRRQEAIDTFWVCERQCYRSNERLSPYLFGGGDERIATVLSAIRKEVSRILGPVPQFLTDARHGPGATYADKGRLSTVPDKMSSVPNFTPDSWPHLLEWVGTAWARACADLGKVPESVRGNRFSTAPKDAKKDRCIAVEPSINIFFQLGVGGAVRRRLAYAGIDLKDGADTHRQVAREASIRGHLATIDLSNASDTVCSNLVKLLLPSKWLYLFESLRSSRTLIEGKWVRLEKFSSMGNGYTFELETLLFYAISRVAVRESGLDPDVETILTYGDDIIVPTAAATNVISVLSFLGFTTNKDKTFIEGRFRESCGGDFFDGEAVRPHHVKELPIEPQDWIRFANGLWRVGTDYAGDSRQYDCTFRPWLRVLDAIPSSIRRCRGPKDLGDIVITDERVDLWSAKWRHSIRYLRVYRPAKFRRISWDHFKPEVVLASALYGTGDGSKGTLTHRDDGGVYPRDNVLGYKLGWAARS